MILTKEQCQVLIDLHDHPKHGSKHISEFTIEDNFDPRGIKKSKIDYDMSLVYRDEETQWFFDLISDYLTEAGYPNNIVKQTLYFNNFAYDPGMKFVRHVDKHRMSEWEMIIGAVLNDDYEGGRVLYYNPDFEVATKPGEIYLTDARGEHEVTEITKGRRYSFVFFLEKRELGIPKELI
jgi:hypothetical protein